MKIFCVMLIVFTAAGCSSKKHKKVSELRKSQSPFSNLVTSDAQHEWALIRKEKSELSREEFINHMLKDYSASDFHDGELDGHVNIAATCQDDKELCTKGNSDQDHSLEIDEYTHKLDLLFSEGDKDNNGMLSESEFSGIVRGKK